MDAQLDVGVDLHPELGQHSTRLAHDAASVLKALVPPWRFAEQLARIARAKGADDDVVKRGRVGKDGNWHRERQVLRQRGHGVGHEPGAEAGVGPSPRHDPSTEGGARVVAGGGLVGGNRGVDVVGVEVAVRSEVAFEDLGALRWGQVAQGSSRSVSPMSAVRVWSAPGPKRPAAENATV